MVIYKVIYKLKSYTKKLHKLISAYLCKLGFKPSKAESEIYMRERLNWKEELIYKCVAMYVNVL